MTTELSRLDALAVEINTIKRQLAQTTVASAIAVGQRLQEAKASVPQGEWGEWLEKNVNFSVRKAEDLMKMAREYGGKDLTVLETLGVTKAVQLLALPGGEREEFIEANAVEDISTRELKELLEQAKAEKEKMQLTIDELMAAPDAASEELAAARAENAALAAEKQQAVDVASTLRAQNARLTEKEKQHAKDEERWKESRHKMQSELAAAEKERDRLQEELDKAGQPIIQQVTPPEVQRELEELRAERKKQQATSGNEQAVAAFRAAFGNFKAALDQMTSALETMGGEVKDRYCMAMEQALQVAGDRVKSAKEA